MSHIRERKIHIGSEADFHMALHDMTISFGSIMKMWFTKTYDTIEERREGAKRIATLAVEMTNFGEKAENTGELFLTFMTCAKAVIDHMLELQHAAMHEATEIPEDFNDFLELLFGPEFPKRKVH